MAAVGADLQGTCSRHTPGQTPPFEYLGQTDGGALPDLRTSTAESSGRNTCFSIFQRPLRLFFEVRDDIYQLVTVRLDLFSYWGHPTGCAPDCRTMAATLERSRFGSAPRSSSTNHREIPSTSRTNGRAKTRWVVSPVSRSTILKWRWLCCASATLTGLRVSTHRPAMLERGIVRFGSSSCADPGPHAPTNPKHPPSSRSCRIAPLGASTELQIWSAIARSWL